MSPDEYLAVLRKDLVRLEKDLVLARAEESRQQLARQEKIIVTYEPQYTVTYEQPKEPPVTATHESSEVIEAKIGGTLALIAVYEREKQSRDPSGERAESPKQFAETRVPEPDRVGESGDRAETGKQFIENVASYHDSVEQVDKANESLAGQLLDVKSPGNQQTYAEVQQPAPNHVFAQETPAASDAAFLAGMALARGVQVIREKFKDNYPSPPGGPPGGGGPGGDPAKGGPADKAIETSEPNQAVAELAAKHAKEQQELQAQLEARAAKHLSEHPAQSGEQRAAQEEALARQAKIAQEAQQRQQEAEMRRAMQHQQDERDRT